MAIPHVLVLAAALVALLCLPCAVAVLICSDDLAVRRAWSRRGRAELVALHCLDRELRGPRVTADPTGTLPFEQVAADLRRLDHQRHTGPTTSSERWAQAVLLAYDERLKLACRYLDVNQHLATVNGLDRDLERVRVESALERAGLELRSAAHRPEK
ncbi:hypothetical protein [Jidongwangia harbinensis]|uniref:hypothetical protein n=1 Tax=Jidongwangia harbinensis TaxID=2878561 RepID=UPI001CD959EC|nr:hypothetical protein [Jidongwangia harbinensis]MCA2214510.1 hypothetical protein [Jidongwangia harbinensis]